MSFERSDFGPGMYVVRLILDAIQKTSHVAARGCSFATLRGMMLLGVCALDHDAEEATDGGPAGLRGINATSQG